MARTRFHDFRQEDSTQLFNDRFRAILPHGVYWGFNVVAGTSGGLYLDFEHDPDPDRTGEVLGTLVTPDGVEIQENEDQQDVVLGSLTAGTPNIHYVVASYTYNRALPNNDVVYTVLQGTSGSPPTPPVLTDDQILLAIIDVPAGAIAYTSAGVRIKTVAKLSLIGTDLPTLFRYFDGVLGPGIYEGINMSVGSTSLKVDLSEGTWITKQAVKITETAVQSDLFTITPPAANNYKLIWVIGAHRHEDISPYPDVDYLLVHGSDAALAGSATLPSDSAIVTAAGAIDSKYDDITYCNKLGYIRITNRAGNYEINYYKGQTVLQEETVIVYAAEDEDLQRSGKYYGHQGLLQAITDIYAFTQTDFTLQKPYKLLLDGSFKMADAGPLYLPSNLRLEAHGGAARLLSEGNVVGVFGFEAIYDSINATVIQAVGPSTPPAGYVARDLSITTTYQVGANLVTRRFCAGDPITLTSTGTAGTYRGWINQYRTGIDNWTVEVFVEQQYNLDGNPTDLTLAFIHRNVEMVGIEVGSLSGSAGSGKLTISGLENGFFDRIRCRSLVKGYTRNSTFGDIEVTDEVSWNGLSYAFGFSERNKYGHLLFRCTPSPVLVGLYDYLAEVGIVEYLNEATLVDFRIGFGLAHIGLVRCKGLTASVITFLATSLLSVDLVSNDGATGDVAFNTLLRSTFHCIFTTNDLLIGAGCSNNTIGYVFSSDVLDTSSDPTNRVLTSSSWRAVGHFLDHPNSDRNLKVVSDANFTWDLASGVLSWDAPISYDNPWTTGYSRVATGNATLSNDGDRLLADIDRDAVAVTAITTSVRAKASATSDEYYKDRVFIAVRFGSTIYLWDGTRIEDGQSVRLGSTPPPDGSVTWVKLADSAIAFHNKFFRDYVIDDDTSSDFENDVIFRNTDLRTLSYTTATGVLQYSGTVDLSAVRPGDYVILRNIDFAPGTAGQSGYTLEEIISVDDANDRVYLSIGLDINGGLGAAHVWNGAIARGAKVFTNNDLITYSYDSTNGRVTYSSAPGFSQYIQVRKGYVWLDSVGVKYPILDVDASGQWVQIPTGLRGVDTTTPTSRHQGSIERNVNPFGIPISDLRVVGGAEFIPIDSYGEIDISPDKLSATKPDLFFSAAKAYANNFNSCELHLPIPYDKRVKLLVEPRRHTSSADDSYEVDDRALRNGHLNYGPMGIKYVSFTGLCSGAAFVYAGGSFGGTLGSVYLDGEEVPSCSVGYHDTENLDNAYGVVPNRYAIQGGETAVTQNQMIARIHRLPYGVHTIVWETDRDSTVIPRGILVFGYHRDGTTTPVVSDAPGTCVLRGGIKTLTETRRLSIPSVNWKGGRLLRYVNRVGGRTFATRSIRTFSTTGNVSNGSADITSVASIASWRIGDIMLIVDPVSGTKYLRRVTVINVPLTQITVDSTIGFTLTGATLNFYGTSYFSPHYRRYEEVAAVYSALDFAAAGPLRNPCTWVGDVSTPPVSSKAFRCSDLGSHLSTTSSAPGVPLLQGGAVDLTTSAHNLIFRFIGTGVSVKRYDWDGVKVWVDGNYYGQLTTNTVLDSDDDPGGTFLCGELPYGQHVVRLENAGVGGCYVYGFTVWKPAKPTVPTADLPVIELLDTNLVADSETSMGITVLESGHESNQFGTIPVDAPNTLVPNTTNATVRDVYSTGLRVIDWAAGGNPAVGDAVDFCFFGDEITLVESLVWMGTDTLEVLFLDHDGVFRRPSALLGFTATGVDTITGFDATPGLRFKWVLSELGSHVIRLRISATAGAPPNTIDCAWFEVHTPYHVHKTKQPIYIDLWVPLQLAGLDVRPLSPFKSDDLAGTDQPHTQGARLSDAPAEQWYNLNPFVFYTRGGQVTLNYSMMGYNDTTLIGVDLYVDGVSCGVEYQQGAAYDWHTFSRTLELKLTPGFHWAYLVVTGTVDVRVGSVRWSMQEITRHPNGISSRSLGVPKIGPANSGLSAF